VKRKTATKRMSRGLKAINQWLQSHLHLPIRDQWEKLKQKLHGHFGPPRKIQRKQGTNVAQVVTKAPRVAARIGGNWPGLFQAPRKPTNCVTMIKGPGVVSASPSPSSI
jgi:hypothetical protein